MSAWTNGTYTHKGLSLLSKLTQGTSLKITKAVAGTGYVDPDILATQKAVSGAKQELAFQAASYPSAGTCKLPVYLTNEKVAAGYKARQIGLYAYDPDEGEILYFVTQSSNGTEVPAASEMPDYSATWTFYLHYGQADTVDITVDPSHTVTTDMLNEVRAIAESGVSEKRTGVVAIFNNAAALPLAGLKVFGKTAQNGTPSPIAPIALDSVSQPTVYLYGKNLCPTNAFDTMSSNGAATTYDAATHTITLDEDATTQSGRYYPPFKKMIVGKPYTVSFDIKGTSGKTVYCGWGDKNTKITLTSAYVRYSCTIVAAKSGEQVIFYTEKTALGGLAAGEYMQFANVQIECGTAASDYEEYKGEQTVAITTVNSLPGVPVSSNGNYTDSNGQQWICDEVDFARGVFVQRVFTEKLTFSYDEVNNRYSATLTHNAKADCGTATSIPVLSDILPYNSAAGSGFPVVNGIRGAATSPKYIIAYYNGEAISTATVMYPLAHPVETALTVEEMASYASVIAHNQNTTVVNDAGAEMEVDLIKAQHEKAFLSVLKTGRVLLWENEAPTESFAPTSVNLDLNRYDGFEIVFYDESYKSTGFIPYVLPMTIKMDACRIASETLEHCQRTATFSKSGINFQVGYMFGKDDASRTLNNGACVPFHIYGIKGLLK